MDKGTGRSEECSLATAAQMVDILTSIRDEGGPADKGEGICGAVFINLNRRKLRGIDQLLPAFREWPEFSGGDQYPVPASQQYDDAAAEYYDTTDMWDPETEYGQARWRLLDFLIEWFEKKAEEEAAKGSSNGPAI